MDRTSTILLVFVLVVIIGFIVILVVFRDNVFNSGKSLAAKSPGDLAKSGYGTYKTVYNSPCITANGKCNIAGIQYNTDYCVPHPETGKGCVDENGEMTYNSKSSSTVCQPNCRKYVLKEITNPNNTAIYDFPFNNGTYTCIPPNVQGYEIREYECMVNDSIGDNTCTYKCGSGVTSSGKFGDADIRFDTYIPTCANNKKATISLNSLPWNNIYSIGSTGFNMSKGYTVYNITLPNGTIDPINFRITPAYPPWSSSPSNNITYEQLKALDKTLKVYDNSIVTNPLPQCDNYFYAQPIEVGSNVTNQQTPNLCRMNYTFGNTKDCYYHPWVNNPGVDVPGGVTGLNFINPYKGATPGLTGSVYSWTGIGNFGYNYTPLICEKTPQPLTPGATAGDYIINAGSGTCPNLEANPYQCANSLTDIFSVVPNQNISILVNNYLGLTGPYTTPVLNTYPQSSGTTNYMCQTIYPNGIKEAEPGCVQTCRYLPTESDIDFNTTDDFGNYISPEIQALLGKYISIRVDEFSLIPGAVTNGTYFLGPQNIPCQNTSNQGIPLAPCYNGSGNSYNSVPCAFIYNGGTGINAGQYWSKNGCDEESIELTSEFKIIVSPHSVYDTGFTTGVTGNSILCDLYVLSNGFYGYLSNEPLDIINPVDISNLFTFSGDVGNIIANTTSSSTNKLYFNALPLGTPIPSNPTGVNYPKFILTYNTGINRYEVFSSNPANTLTNIDLYDGVNYTQNLIAFTFTTEANKILGVPYFVSKGYDDPIIKTSGIYIGQDVTRTISLQTSVQCYTKNLCESTSVPSLCYNSTCNLYYKNEPEFCG